MSMGPVPPLAVALLWPALLPWLLAVGLPVVLAWWALKHARRVRWGAIDLVAQAAREAGITRSGMPLLLTVVRTLLVAGVVLAATRPFLPRSDAAAGTQLVAGDAARRIELVAAGTSAGDSSVALQRAIEAVVKTRPRFPVAVDRLPLRAAGRPPVDRRLIILCDGVVPADDDAARLAAAVRGGAALLVCVGPDSIAPALLPRLSAWLDELTGVAVATAAPLEHETIDVADVRHGIETGGFSPLPGPCVDQAAVFSHLETVRPAATVLARSTRSGRPLLIDVPVGRGRVCLSALPLALAAGGERAWSDLAAWPSFVPFVDRVVSGLLGPADPGDMKSPRPPDRFAGLPLAGLLLACSIALAGLEAFLSPARLGSAGGLPSLASLGGRVALVAACAAMMAAWGGRPAERATQPLPAAAVALMIDVSPSMATADLARPASAGPSTSRLRALIDALLGGAGETGVLDRLARERPVLIHAVAKDVRPLGRYPDDVTAADLRNLAPSPAAAGASRLGDAVTDVLRERRLTGVAAVVVISDGAISGGASWAAAAGLATRQGVPLVVVPVGSDLTAATGVPAGLRFTALDAPAVVPPGEAMVVPVRARASTGSASPVALTPDGGKGEIIAGAAGIAGYGYAGLWTERGQPPAVGQPSARVVTHALTVGDDVDGRHAATVSVVVAADPIRVLLVDRGPRFEFRFLERLLAADPRYVVSSRLSAAGDTGGFRNAGGLPRSQDAWRAFDVVVVGDLPIAAAEDPVPWDALREAVIHDGVGVAWLPGRRWAEADAGLISWLPAEPDPATAGAAAATVPRLLRLLAAGEAIGALPFVTAGDAEAAVFKPTTFSPVGPVVVRPTARVIAVTDGGPGPAPEPAIVVDRAGRGTVVGHLCDTWRWRDGAASGGPTAHARYWGHLLPRLAERRRLERLVAARLVVLPPDPVVGEPVRVDVVPTRPTTDLSGWTLAIDAPDGRSQDHRIVAAGPGSVAALRLDELAAGRHRLRLVAASGAADDLPVTPVEREIIVNEPLVERSAGPAGIGPLQAAVDAGGGRVVPLDSIATLPATIAEVAAVPRDRAAVDRPWFSTEPAAHLLLVLFVTACTVAWWPRIVPPSARA